MNATVLESALRILIRRRNHVPGRSIETRQAVRRMIHADIIMLRTLRFAAGRL